jgi:hypothetical protein
LNVFNSGVRRVAAFVKAKLERVQLPEPSASSAVAAAVDRGLGSGGIRTGTIGPPTGASARTTSTAGQG